MLPCYRRPTCRKSAGIRLKGSNGTISSHLSNCLSDMGNRRQLSEPQKKSYIDAVLCLTKKNATSGIANPAYPLGWPLHSLASILRGYLRKGSAHRVWILRWPAVSHKVEQTPERFKIDWTDIGTGLRTRSQTITAPRKSLRLPFLTPTPDLAVMAITLSLLQSRIP
jgi:hypothetical protein